MVQQRLAPSPEQISRTLAEILDHPDFDTLQGNFLRVLVARLWEWLKQFFSFDPEMAGPLFALLLAVAGVCAGVFLLARRRRPQPGAVEGRPEELPPTERSAADWLRVAAERARTARYRRAATALYQGFLLTLEQKGALAFHPSKTPGEYALEAAQADVIGAPDKARATTFIRSFQELAFGPGAPTPTGYLELEQLAGRAGCRVADGGTKRARG